MAKQSMIQRDRKRFVLMTKFASKREFLKKESKT